MRFGAFRPATWAGSLCLLAACGTASANGPDRVTIDTLANGVVQVTNPERGAWTESTAWRAVEDLRIGSADGGGPDMLAMPMDVEEDGAGRIYVLDGQAMEIRVFNAAGRHVRSFGRQGAGPGELRQPLGMTWGPKGELWVADFANARYSVFDTTGTFRRSYLRHNNTLQMPWPGVVDQSGRLYDTRSSDQDGQQVAVLLRYDPSVSRAEAFALPHRREQMFEVRDDRRRLSNAIPVPFAPRVEWALAPDGRVWSGGSERYRLEQRDADGRLLRIAERPYTPVKVERAELDSIPVRHQDFVQRGGKIDLAAVPKEKPAFVSIQVDDRGYLWVRPSAPLGQQGTAFDVFEPTGVYLGRLQIPLEIPEFMPIFVHGAHVYSVTMTDEGVPQVVRFRLEGREA
ncbi:MAG TPA: 6-bladed beta-propeller [Longimicrobium sp.]